jgi:SAM-dependent methyltransferase
MLASSNQDFADLYVGIESYYSQKVSVHGRTPWGVDWSCIATQEARFAQLLKLCDFSRPFALNDVGCGYGALWSYLTKYHDEVEIDYLGLDVSPAMIRHASMVRRDLSRANFMVASASPRVADYSVASGIFNVKLAQPLDRWERFIANTLIEMRAASRRGFAVNFMTPLGPGRPVRSVYRTVPKPWVEFCASEFGASTDILADYGLREFTLLVRLGPQATMTDNPVRACVSSGS